MYELKEGQGSLFRNDEKATERHPDYSGTILIGGVAYYLSGWIKESQNGRKYMSLSAKPKDAKPAAKPASKNDDPFADARAGDLSDMTKDIPF